jgi:hypothetical protein
LKAEKRTFVRFSAAPRQWGIQLDVKLVSREFDGMISIVSNTMKIGSTEQNTLMQTTPDSIAQLTKGVISKGGDDTFFITFLRVFYGLTEKHPDRSVKIGLPDIQTYSLKSALYACDGD